jgi:type II secretion system protein C
MKGSIIMNINFNQLIQKILPYSFIFLLAYLINSIAFFYLPKVGVEFKDNNIGNLEYKNYSGFYSKVQIVQESKEVKKCAPMENFSKYNLKAVYSTTSNGGWITIENGDNSFILSQGENIDGYVLSKLFKSYVIFEKSQKEYKLEMKEKDNISYELTEDTDDIKQNIIVKDDLVKVNRTYLNSYVQNLDKVWNNIAINEKKVGNKIEGFEVLKVNQDSVFAKLGLKAGDVIKSINNNSLNSYADAFNVYNNIGDTRYLNIEILRNNEVVELNYEID